MNKTWPEDSTRKGAKNQPETNIWNINPEFSQELIIDQDSELLLPGSSGSKQLPSDYLMQFDTPPEQSVDYEKIQKDAETDWTALSDSSSEEKEIDELEKYLEPVQKLIERIEEKIKSGDKSISSDSSLTSITEIPDVDPEMRALKAMRNLTFQEDWFTMLSTDDTADLVDHDANQIAHQEMLDRPSTSAAAPAAACSSTSRKSRVIKMAQNLMRRLVRSLHFFSAKARRSSGNDQEANDGDGDDERKKKSEKKHYKLFSNPLEYDEVRPSILYNTLHSLAKLTGFFNRNRKNTPKSKSPNVWTPKGEKSSSKSVSKPTMDTEEWQWIVWDLCNYKSKTIRAFMPNDEFTVISLNLDQTLRQALERSIKKRHFDPELCTIFNSNTNEKLDWDICVASLKGGTEIRVEYNGELLIPNQISHKFVQRPYFTVTICENCNAVMFHGFGCDFCGAKFHQCCVQSMPILAQPLRLNNYYRQVMAINLDSLHPLNNQFNAGNSVSNQRLIKESGSSGGSYLALPPIRSVSSPDFCMDGTVATIDTDGRIRSPKLVYHHFPVNDETESNLELDLQRFYEGLPEMFLVDSEPRSQSLDPFCSAKRRNISFNNISLVGNLTSAYLYKNTDHAEAWQIGYENIVFGKLISSGSFGAVYTGTYNRTPVALKKLKIICLNRQQKRQLKREIEVLHQLHHVNLVQLIGCISKPYWTLVSEWCQGRTLYQHLHFDELQLEAEELVNIASQISQGMNYLHSKLIIHRSLKSTNIFLHDDFVVKISDYGLPIAKLQWDGKSYSILPNGIDLWMAPEVISTKTNDPFTTKSDVYSFGIVLFEMCTGYLPFKGINQDQIIYLVENNLLRPELYLVRREHTPEQYVTLMKKSLLTDLVRRPSFGAIVKHLEAIAKKLPEMCKEAGSSFDLRSVTQKNEDPDHDQHVHDHYGAGKKCGLYKRMKLERGMKNSLPFETLLKLASKFNNISNDPM